MAVDIQPACLGLYCGKTLLFKNGSTEIYGECGVCPRGQRTNAQKYCQPCTESPELYDWLYLGFMAMLPLVLHWFFIEWYSGKKSSSALFQHITALFECSMAAIITLLVSDPVGVLYIRSCRVLMLSDWYTMLYNPSPDYITTVHCTHEAVYPLYTIVFIYYAFCLVLMMLLRPLLVKKIACGLGKSDRFKSIYAALYFFPILTVLQAVGGGLLYYAFPYIILVLSLVTLAVYMSASEIEVIADMEAQVHKLREELINVNSQRKQQLVELGLLREEEKQRAARDHETAVNKLKAESEKMKMELKKTHAAETEMTLEKASSRLKQIEKEYTQKLAKSSQIIAELQTTISSLKEESSRQQLAADRRLQDVTQKLEDEKQQLIRDNDRAIKALQDELESRSIQVRCAEKKLQHKELESQEQITYIRQEYETKFKGLMPASLRQELEDTISSLKSQVNFLQKRASVLQEELTSYQGRR